MGFVDRGMGVGGGWSYCFCFLLVSFVFSIYLFEFLYFRFIMIEDNKENKENKDYFFERGRVIFIFFLENEVGGFIKVLKIF